MNMMSFPGFHRYIWGCNAGSGQNGHVSLWASGLVSCLVFHQGESINTFKSILSTSLFPGEDCNFFLQVKRFSPPTAGAVSSSGTLHHLSPGRSWPSPPSPWRLSWAESPGRRCGRPRPAGWRTARRWPTWRPSAPSQHSPAEKQEGWEMFLGHFTPKSHLIFQLQCHQFKLGLVPNFTLFIFERNFLRKNFR